MWTAKNRGRYDRSKLRYPSDLTDDEWAHVEPLIQPAVSIRQGGMRLERLAQVCLRDMEDLTNIFERGVELELAQLVVHRHR